MTQLNVSIPPAQLKQLEDLGSGEQMRRALYQAYKRTAREIRVDTQKVVKSRSSLATSRIREALKDGVDFPLTMQQRGRMTITQIGIPLRDYKPKFSKGGGMRVKLPKGELVFTHAFRATMPNGKMLAVARGRTLPKSGPNWFKTRFKARGEKLPAQMQHMTAADVDSKLNTNRWRKGKGFTPRGFVQRLTLRDLRGPSVLTTVGEKQLTDVGQEVMRNAQDIFEKNLASQIVFRSQGPQAVFDASNRTDFTGGN